MKKLFVLALLTGAATVVAMQWPKIQRYMKTERM